MQKQGLADTVGNRTAALPTEGFVRLKTVLAVVPVGESRWYQGVNTGEFPAPVKIGPRMNAWRVRDIRELIAKLESGGASARAA